MKRRWKSFVILAATMVSLLSAGQGSTEKAWKNKPDTEWTADDAHQVMTDSPWAKTTIPVMEKAANEGPHRGGGGGRGGGIGIGGVGIGLPGMGRRGGGGYPRGGVPSDTGGGRTDSGQAPR